MGKLKLSAIFSDGIILQRDTTENVIWGISDPDSEVTLGITGDGYSESGMTVCDLQESGHKRPVQHGGPDDIQPSAHVPVPFRGAVRDLPRERIPRRECDGALSALQETVSRTS